MGLTQDALAARVGDGVRQSDISRLERDKVNLPHPTRVWALARALELAPGELLVHAGWTGAEQPVIPGPPVEPAGSQVLAGPRRGAGPTRLGQALLDAQATAPLPARSLAQAELVLTWATDPRACRQPFVTFTRDRRTGHA